MRTFLTYVLAAFAAAAVFHLGPVFSYIVRGEPVPTGFLGAIAIILPVSTALVGMVGGAFWALTGLVTAAVKLNRHALISIPRGVVAFLLIGFTMLGVWTTWYGVQDAPGASSIATVVGATARPLVVGLFGIMGLVWGSVFWLRTPKPQTVEAAA